MELSWVKQHAYKDGRFLLERLFSQVASDVHEVSKLPDELRRNWKFKILRRPDAQDRFSVVGTLSQDQTASMLFVAGYQKVQVREEYGVMSYTLKARWYVDWDTKDSDRN